MVPPSAVGFVEPDACDVPLTQRHVGHAQLRHGEPSKYESGVRETEAIQVMKQLRFSLPEARVFVARAAHHLPREATFEQLVRRSLRFFQERDFGDGKLAQ